MTKAIAPSATLNALRVGILFFIVSLTSGCLMTQYTAGTLAVVDIANDRVSAGVLFDDTRLELTLLGKIHNDEEINKQSHISVNIKNGVILLTGESPRREITERILTLARTFEHTRQIVNQIATIKISDNKSRARDLWLLGRVKWTLVTSDDFDEKVQANTSVIVERGIVYLMGIVTREEARVATDIIRKVPMVKKIIRVFEYLD